MGTSDKTPAPSSTAADSNEPKSVAPKAQAPTPTPIPDYVLPDWFMQYNVYTQADLADIETMELRGPKSDDAGSELDVQMGDNSLETPSGNTKVVNSDGCMGMHNVCRATSSASSSNCGYHTDHQTEEGSAVDIPELDFDISSSFRGEPPVWDLRQEIETSKFRISPVTFEQLKDTTRDILLYSPETNLMRRNCSILLNAEVRSPIDPFNRILARLAKDMHADLITLDMQDMQDLAWHFNSQERGKGWQAQSAVQFHDSQGYDTNYYPENARFEEDHLYEPYFKEPSSSKYGGNKPDRRTISKAIRSIIHASRRKAELANDPADAIEMSGIDGKTRPIFLHLRQSGDFMERTQDRAVVKAFRTSIERGSSHSEGIVLFASDAHMVGDSKRNIPACKCRTCSKSLWKSLHRCLLTTLVLHFGTISYDELEDESPTESSRFHAPWYAQTRRLKRLLRFRLPSSFDLYLTEPQVRWSLDKALETSKTPEELSWNDSDFWRAVQQITGRALAGNGLTLEDIATVLKRPRSQIEGSSPDENPSKKSSSSDSVHGKDEHKEDEQDVESAKVKNAQRRIENIRRGCNKYEAKLMNCIVDPQALSSGYDEVIIDEATKATVQQMVSLSQLRAEGKSQRLLQMISLDGILLYGPPGTGKTHLARAIAKQADAVMLAVAPSNVQNPWVGETEKNLTAIFSLAKKLHPCVVFFDEVDALFYRRSSSNKSWERNAITQILQEMDGLVSGDKRPLVVAATNRPTDIDDAFLRRLPQKIFFGLPSQESRVQILKLFLHEDDVDPLVNVEGLAEVTVGFSGSDLKSLCGQAALAWAVEQADKKGCMKLKLTMSHFAVALQRAKPTVSHHSLMAIESFKKRFEHSSGEADIVSE